MAVGLWEYGPLAREIGVELCITSTLSQFSKIMQTLMIIYN
jgi:hypothetical protein